MRAAVCDGLSSMQIPGSVNQRVTDVAKRGGGGCHGEGERVDVLGCGGARKSSHTHTHAHKPITLSAVWSRAVRRLCK